MRILILCTGNTCRSPMAEGIVKQLLQQNAIQDVEVESMGFAAYDGDLPTAHAIAAMMEIEIDIGSKESRRVTQQDLEQIDHFYVMTPSHQYILTDLSPELEQKITVLDIPDPYGQDLETYRTCRDQMQSFFENELQRWSNTGDHA